MFPVTLQRHDKTIATLQPPCYGFLRDVEWSDWDQRFHHGSWHINYDSMVDEDSEEEDIFNSDMVCYGDEQGDSDLPKDAFAYEDLYAIWNSGAELPSHGYHNGQLYAIEWCNGKHSRDLTSSRPKNALEKWCEANKHTVTMREVMEALEAACDAGRESCLVWDESSGFMGARCNVPCDRALFYLMVNRELASLEHHVDQMFYFLDQWLIGDKPIMIAFLMSRLIGVHSCGYLKGQIGWMGGNHDSCILPAQNFWVGMGKRFATPTAIQWNQHSYNSGTGHYRDDDLSPYDMNPTIEGFVSCYEQFNGSMFDAVFGGTIADEILTDGNGNPVRNLVCEFYRAVANPETYAGTNAGGSYVSYWQSDRALHGRTPENFRISFDRYPEIVYKLLMDE